jgi:hypothetical protein
LSAASWSYHQPGDIDTDLFHFHCGFFFTRENYSQNQDITKPSIHTIKKATTKQMKQSLLLTLLLLLLPQSIARKQGKYTSFNIPPFPAPSNHLSIDYSRYIPPGVRAYDPLSPNDTCYTPLYDSDINGDGKVGHDEYVEFITALEPRLSAEEFKEMSFVLKVNFVYLSCLCAEGGNNCCNGEYFILELAVVGCT